MSQSSVCPSSKSTVSVDMMSQSQSNFDTAMLESTIVDKFGGSTSLPSSPPRYHPTIPENDELDGAPTTEQVVSDAEHEFHSIEQDIPAAESEIFTTVQFTAAEHSPEIHKPESVEQHFAEDSGIVDNIEQARAALDDDQNESECSDR